MEVGYWNIRGLAAPLRMMSYYAQAPFTDVQYSEQNPWFGNAKKRIAALNPMANLPYVIDGDTCICQSIAVYVYVAEKLGLYKGIRDLELLAEVYDLRNAHIALVYPFVKAVRDRKEYEVAAIDLCTQTVPAAYSKLEGVLTNNGDTKYMLGDTPCAADFHIWEMLDQHEMLAKNHEQASPLASFPKLSVYYDTFKAEPTLAAYFSSPSYALPINHAKSGAYFY